MEIVSETRGVIYDEELGPLRPIVNNSNYIVQDVSYTLEEYISIVYFTYIILPRTVFKLNAVQSWVLIKVFLFLSVSACSSNLFLFPFNWKSTNQSVHTWIDRLVQNFVLIYK